MRFEFDVHRLTEVEMPVLCNLLMFDAIENEWRIGHARQVLPGVECYACACTVEEGNELITDGEPVPVFSEVSHWARLPASPTG